MSSANLESELCVGNLQIGQILVHTLLPVWHVYTLIEQWHIVRLLSRGQKFPSYWQRRSATNCQQESQTMYRNTLLTDHVWLCSAIFDWVSWHPTCMHRNAVSLIIVSYVARFSTELTPLYLLSMLRAVLWAQAKDYVANRRVIAQSLDLRLVQDKPRIVLIHTLHINIQARKSREESISTLPSHCCLVTKSKNGPQPITIRNYWLQYLL